MDVHQVKKFLPVLQRRRIDGAEYFSALVSEILSLKRERYQGNMVSFPLTVKSELCIIPVYI